MKRERFAFARVPFLTSIIKTSIQPTTVCDTTALKLKGNTRPKELAVSQIITVTVISHSSMSLYHSSHRKDGKWCWLEYGINAYYYIHSFILLRFFITIFRIEIYLQKSLTLENIHRIKPEMSKPSVSFFRLICDSFSAFPSLPTFFCIFIQLLI